MNVHTDPGHWQSPLDAPSINPALSSNSTQNDAYKLLGGFRSGVRRKRASPHGITADRSKGAEPVTVHTTAKFNRGSTEDRISLGAFTKVLEVEHSGVKIPRDLGDTI